MYSELLVGVSKRQAFEESAEFLDLAVGTVKQWELEYRTKGHIGVSAMILSAQHVNAPYSARQRTLKLKRVVVGTERN